jgi:hypothetical protein
MSTAPQKREQLLLFCKQWDGRPSETASSVPEW